MGFVPRCARARAAALGAYALEDGTDGRALVEELPTGGGSAAAAADPVDDTPAIEAPAMLAEPVLTDTPHVDVQLPIGVAGEPLSPRAPAPSGYPKAYDPADFPTTIVTDQSGNAVDPEELMVVTAGNGDPLIVPKLSATAPAIITVYTPDVVEWRVEPGSGGLVLRRYVNGVKTDELAASSPTFDSNDPSKAFTSMTDAQLTAYWTLQRLAGAGNDPAAIAELQDYRNREGASITDVGRGAIAILQAAGATEAAKIAASVAGTTVAAATSGIAANVPGRPAGGTTTTQATPIYTGATRPLSPRNASHPTTGGSSAQVNPTEPIVSIGAQPAMSSRWKWGLGIAAGVAAIAALSRR